MHDRETKKEEHMFFDMMENRFFERSISQI